MTLLPRIAETIDAELIRQKVLGSSRDHALTAGVALEGAPVEALRNLTHEQQQLDQDGVFVGVSRQALDEVLTFVNAVLTRDRPETREPVFRNPGERIGHENRGRVRHLLLTKPGIKHVEISKLLNLSPVVVGKHVARIRKEWRDQ